MRKSICFFAFWMAILCFNLTATKAIAGDKTKDNFFPIVRLIATPVLISEDAAFSLLIEGGPRSYRFNGTLGFICENNRFKISAENLTQRLHYHFDSGKTHHWMHQLALGGQYQYIVDCPCFFEGIQLGLQYSNAPSKGLSTERFGENEFLLRRIAGSWNWTAEAGFIVTPWECAQFIGSLTYDQVRYRREYQDGKRISGVGFSLDFTQRFWRNLIFDINFEYKQAYNNLGVALRWIEGFDCGDLDVGIFTYHVFGKRNLPCSTTAGIELGFAFGICECNLTPISCCNDYYNDGCCSYDSCDLVAWVSDPAVYMPQVLAITDQAHCCAPVLSNVEGSFTTTGVGFGDTTTYSTASFFNGECSDVTYTAENLPTGSSINHETGVITLVNPLLCNQSPFATNIWVTAHSDCGSESGSFVASFQGAECDGD